VAHAGVPPRAARTPLDGYQRRLMLFLSVATFFEGFDFFALAQILPSLRSTFRLTEAGAGVLVGVINVGPVLAYLLVRQADRWGRRPVLSVTILGYTALSLLSGLAPDVWTFGACQLLARVFLIGEWAVAMIYAAEEYPADRRGLVIGVIQACSSLGAVVCAAVVPLLLRSPVGWRSVFLVGALPLLVIAFARRNLRETQRFLRREIEPASGSGFTRVWRTRWRGRVVLLAVIWALTYVCTTTAMLFWKEFAVSERGFTDGQVGASMTVAALLSMPLAFMVGKLVDAIGRRHAAVLIFVMASVSVAGAYTLHSPLALTVALVAGIFGTTAVLPVLNAYTTELFPTELRSDAFAWSNNLLGRVGAVLAPLAVGAAAGVHGWGPAVAATTIGPLLALGLILWKLPETTGLELEQTSALAEGDQRTPARL
jgi:putative MFS transporter